MQLQVIRKLAGNVADIQRLLRLMFGVARALIERNPRNRPVLFSRHLGKPW